MRFFEVDQQKVVYHMWYLAYFEDARNAMLAERGLPLRGLQKMGLDLQIVHYELDWRAPVRWEDRLQILVDVVRIGNTSFRLRYEATAGERSAVVGEATYVVIDCESGRPARVPDRLEHVLTMAAR